MTDAQRSKLKDQLLQEKRRLEKRLKGNQNYGLEQGMNDSIGELSGYDNHPGDIGTELYERGKDLALNEADEERLKAIDQALVRMEEGQYGICVVCGREIPFERLEAVPETAHCVEHEPERTVSGRRPVEEQVIHPPFGEHSYDDQDRTFYDAEDAWQEVERYGTSNPPDMFREGRDYNQLTIDRDENRGYVDDLESVAVSDITGRSSQPLPEFTRNEAYERTVEKETEKEDEG
jgi:YteA family regulatory protein